MRVLIVDDHPLFRDGVSGLLSSVPGTTVVGTAATAEEAVREATLTRPDVVLLDLNLPGGSGLTAIPRILAACPGTAVLVLTMVEDDRSLTAALRAGASGYLLKGVGQEELLAALRTIVGGGAVFTGAVADRIRSGRTGHAADLTGREAEVLELLVEGREPGAIARDLGLSTKTVQNHVSRILAKFQARDRVELIFKVRGL
ncbi:response regulator transcription factor [Luedemannella flava]|uniref:Response regulator transcription factor n=1 Tax=Luedemannella flava TaxID=349316 RepID=A0ABP4XHI2_9ACTN